MEEVAEKPPMEAAAATAPEQSEQEADKTLVKNPPVNKTIGKTTRRRSSKAKRVTTDDKNTRKSQASSSEFGALKPTAPFTGIEKSIVENAVQALMNDYERKHHRANDKESAADTVRLIDDVSKVSLVFTLKVPPSKSRFKPKRMYVGYKNHLGRLDLWWICQTVSNFVTFFRAVLGGCILVAVLLHYYVFFIR